MAVPNLAMNTYRNDSYEHNFLWQDSTGTPIDLTGYSARMQARTAEDVDPPLLDISSLAEILLGGSAGTIQIKIPASLMDIDSQENVYDLEMTAQDGTVTTIVRGPFHVTPDVTK